MGQKIFIAGGGIIGLSIALELASAGAEVTVLERGQPMCEASWAAAGMLAADDPENPPELAELSQLSRKLWPGYRNRVAGLSGMPIPFRTTTTLQGPRRGERWNRCALPGTILTAAQAAGQCPGLNTEERPEYLLLDELSLDPRNLCTALPRAATAAGVRILPESGVLNLRETSGRIEVESPTGLLVADKAVIATGAWAAALMPPTTAPLGLEPRKGHIVTVQLPEGARLPVVLRTPEIYLVPRGDGRVVIGATVEREGFNKAVNEAVIARLIEEAALLFPAVRRAEIVECWTGLRPGSADGLPVLGWVSEHIYAATGHYRNGILLAPATARLAALAVTGGQPELDLSCFGPSRHSTPSHLER